MSNAQLAHAGDEAAVRGLVNPPEKPHLSHTQMDMLWRCGEQYRRRYVESERLPPSIAMLIGTGHHKGAEHNFRQKIDSHRDLPSAEIVDAAVAGFDAETAGEYALTPEEADRGAKIVLGEARDKLVDLATLYAAQQAPDYQPVAVERATRIVFPAATHDLLAITDLRDDCDRVTDFKTASRKMPEDAVHTSVQLTVYAAAYQVDNARPPSEVRLDVATKTKTPQRQLLRSQRTQADMVVLLNRVNVSLASIQAGNFLPASPGSWVCSPKWCGYWHSCPYVNSERRAAAEGSE
ncbi:MAG: PD-(D/E)XK nuclease family protein [Phycisphaerae bacterium]